MEAASGTAPEAGFKTIETRIPARLDRLPWSSFHWRVVIGLGVVWILDGLEVTIIGFLAPTLTDPGSGIALTEGDIALAQSIYVAGACIGALFFGQLTDRFGRKKLFLITLSLYLLATVATAFSTTPLWFLAARFFTGAGIGGEYSAINSAIDEMIPARARGRVDLIINGSFWLGAVAGGLLSLVLLQESLFALDVGWRLSFGLGALLGRRDPARAPPPAGEPALAVHPRPRGGGRAARRRDRGRGQGGHRPGARGAGRLDQGPPAPLDPVPRDRPDRVQGLSEAGRARASRCSSARPSSTTRSPSRSGSR